MPEDVATDAADREHIDRTCATQSPAPHVAPTSS